jgi:hypothetical protein
MTEAVDLYLSGEYGTQHEAWHLQDAAHKVQDVLPTILAIINTLDHRELRVADVGAGAGGVSAKLLQQLFCAQPNINVSLTGFEISLIRLRKLSGFYLNGAFQRI